MKEIIERKSVETYEREPINSYPLKRKSQAKTFQGYIEGLIIKCDNDKNYELSEVFKVVLKKYLKFHSKAKVPIKSWKGKSSIQIINKPDSFDVIRYQKKDQDSLPKEIIKNILKEDVNRVIMAINRCGEEKNIKTRNIAKEYCKIDGLEVNMENLPFFDDEGFIWEHFFGDREKHNFLTNVLGILHFYNIINYSGGLTEVLKKVVDIQTILH